MSTASDVFTTRMLGLEGQATALAAAVTRLTAAPEPQQFAARMRAQAGDAKRMRKLIGEWHQPAAAPYSPGASLPAGVMGTGMMHAADWAEISHEHGQSFSSRWLDVIISSYTTPKSRYPGKNSARVPARRPATGRTMLAERQSELARLRQWHQDGQMGMMG